MKANTKNKPVLKTERKQSNKKKLLSAVSMFTVSAIMLSTATYAWFTMSREVEVTGIQMTATVPEDLQISLGLLGTAPTTKAKESDEISLASNSGVLVNTATDATNADNGTVSEPENSWDWSNTADISKYYYFGKLMPASSTTGATIYYTPDATGVGKTVSSVAKYFAANSGLTSFKTGGTAAAGTSDDDARTTLHAITAKTNNVTINDSWNDTSSTSAHYTVATGWDDTNDDGYYVDIPVWLRSSATEDINVAVAGYVLPGDTNVDSTNGTAETDLELYRAVRVAILNGDEAGIKTKKTETTVTSVDVGSAVTANNILPLVDAWNTTDTSGYTTSNGVNLFKKIITKSNPYTLATNDTLGILDSDNYTERMSTADSTVTGLWGVSALTAYSSDEQSADLTGHITTSDNKATYKSYTQYTGGTPIATVKAPTTGDDYGDAKKLIIRVWLDGEDAECWNDNAGQDWKISLEFTKVDIPAS